MGASTPTRGLRAAAVATGVAAAALELVVGLRVGWLVFIPAAFFYGRLHTTKVYIIEHLGTLGVLCGVSQLLFTRAVGWAADHTPEQLPVVASPIEAVLVVSLALTLLFAAALWMKTLTGPVVAPIIPKKVELASVSVEAPPTESSTSPSPAICPPNFCPPLLTDFF